ncbi:MAG: S41 family peptidase [Chitinophagales bacterium]|nr:S41 family peptidase [Chitinophagales bacterium]MCZ2393889.1 S41 family peptidase [Chitinophagales bacterium]
MSYFLKLLQSQYVEEVNMDSIVEIGITNILEHLDPHSVYMNKEDLKKANEPLEGNFEGVGIQFNIIDDTINIVHVIVGGPSQRVGLQDGDKIITVDGDTMAGNGVTNEKVFKRLRGPKGTEVVIGVSRIGEPNVLEFLVVRDKIPLYALDAAYLNADKTGYIKLSRFSATATKEVKSAIDSLNAMGMKNLILDLTGNGGGYLNQAQGLADLFLDDNKLIVYTEGRAQPRQELHAEDKGPFEKGRLVIMVDGASASASEIVSGAVQDWDRGVLVGRRTYGKGLVQKSYTLPDYSAIRLTMAHYYIPSGRCIQKPYKEGKEKYAEDLYERYESGELFDKNKIVIEDSTVYYTKGKRLVYGGGGVIPDIYVPADTSWRSDFYSKLLRSGLFSKFTLKYVNEHRVELNQKYPNLETFIQNFHPEGTLWMDFLAYAEEKDIKSEEDYSVSIKNMQLQLKGLVAQYLFDSKAYFQIINEIDPIYNKAIEIINSKTYKSILKCND